MAENLNKAVAAYQAALEVFTPEFGPYHTGTKARLERLLAAIEAADKGD